MHTPRYLRPTSPADAAELALRGGVLLGGGTLLMSALWPFGRPSVIVDLIDAGVSDVHADVAPDGTGELRIGAATRVEELRLATAEDARWSAVHEAAAAMVPVAIRRAATVGGNVATGVGSLRPALRLFGALCTVRREDGVQTVGLDNWRPGFGLIEEIRLRALPAGTRTGRAGIRRSPVGPGIVVVAVADGPDNVCVVVGGHRGRHPHLAVLELPAGAEDNVVREAVQGALPGAVADHHASAEYRRAMAGVLAATTVARLRSKP